MRREAGSAVIEIDLAGGRLASLVTDHLSLLVAPVERPTRWGSFPMIPWCGRLPHGVLHADGTDYDFPITSPPHANHGLTHLQPWTQIDDITIRTELADPWPFGGYAIQRFELTETSLTVTAEVHAGQTPMPAMAGWHPWFNRQLDYGGPAELTVDPARMYAVDDEATPTGELVDVPPGPWDACFTGLSADPVIEWPDALELTISSSFTDWVIFTEPTHALCVEPQSGPPNQVNLNPMILDPGESLVGTMTFTWSSKR